MTVQEAKRIRRAKRLHKPVRMSKEKAKELGIPGQRPVVKSHRIKKQNKSTEPPELVAIPAKFAKLFMRGKIINMKIK
jgi:hypothetical protein